MDFEEQTVLHMDCEQQTVLHMDYEEQTVLHMDSEEQTVLHCVAFLSTSGAESYDYERIMSDFQVDTPVRGT